jgi:hypothetical protein
MTAYCDLLEVLIAEYTDQVVKIISETESFTLGLNANKQSDVILTYKVIAKPDTDTAKNLGDFQGKTVLSGFYVPDSIYAIIAASSLQDYQKESLKRIAKAYIECFLDKLLVNAKLNIDNSPNPLDVKKLLDKLEVLVAKIPSVLEKTINAGKVEVAESITSDGVLLLALKIGGGNELIDPFNKLCDQFQESIANGLKTSEKNPFSFAKEDYKGYRIWSFSAVFSEESNSPFPAFGYCLGLKDDVFFFAEGISPDTLKIVKQAIDGSGTLQPLPKDVFVIAPAKIGDLIKKYGFDKVLLDGVHQQPAAEALKILYAIPQDAKITISEEVKENTLTQTAIFSGKLWKAVGDYAELIYKAIQEHGLQGFSLIP